MGLRPLFIMLNKIIFTKDQSIKNIDQLQFEMPVGYKLYATSDTEVSSNNIKLIDLKVSVFTNRPATFIYTSAIHSIDFKIIDTVQMIAPNVQTPLTLSIINPIVKSESWIVKKGDLIATLLVVETYTVNLFEVSNKVFKEYV